MYYRVIVEPPVEPLTLTEVKLAHSVEHALYDTMLTDMIKEAREHAEKYLQRSLVTQTREIAYDSFMHNMPWELPAFYLSCQSRWPLQLLWGPVQEVLALEYVAADGTVTPITNYQSDLYAPVPRLLPAFNTYWPQSVGADVNAVRVRYIAGYPPVYGSPTDYTSNIPGPIKRGMQLLIGHLLENREATIQSQRGLGLVEIPLGVQSLWSQYKLSLGMA